MIDRERLSRRFAKLVEIDSPSCHERKMADALKEIFHELGIELSEDSSHIESGFEAGNLYAYVPGEIGASPLLFSGHMDSERLEKVLPVYCKKPLAEGRTVEILFHPGSVKKEEITEEFIKPDFNSFHLSKNRRLEYTAIVSLHS